MGMRSGRFTRVSVLISGVIGTALTLLFYGILLACHGSSGLPGLFAESFLDRGICPYFTAWLFWWSLAILILKIGKLRLQRRTLGVLVVPNDPQFVLSSDNVDVVTSKIFTAVDDPKRFVLFNRILIALSNLRNLGRVADVDEILRSQAEQDESTMETTYLVLQAFVWAIPVLGFIGTVIGLSQAIGSFGQVLGQVSEVSELSSALRGVTSGLSTAFETTLQALVAALIIQLLLTMTKKSEEEFLDDCAEYCVRHLVGKLRIMPFESTAD